MLSFTELDADFDDEILNARKPDATTLESPTEIARPAKRKGLTQKLSRKPEPMEEEIVEEEEEIYDHDRFGGGDGGFADESYEHDEPVEDILQEDFEEEVEEVEEEEEEDEVQVVEEEEDIYGTQKPSPIIRKRGRPKGSSQKPAKKAPSKQRTKSSSSQPAPKRARTTSSAPRSPKILQRKEIPHPADVSTIDGESTPPSYYFVDFSSSIKTNSSSTTSTLERRTNSLRTRRSSNLRTRSPQDQRNRPNRYTPAPTTPSYHSQT